MTNTMGPYQVAWSAGVLDMIPMLQRVSEKLRGDLEFERTWTGAVAKTDGEVVLELTENDADERLVWIRGTEAVIRNFLSGYVLYAAPRRVLDTIMLAVVVEPTPPDDEG